ncbi:hypothetical protein D9M70_587490 [compost metagenome]
MLSISVCGCSARTPKAKGLASIYIFFRSSSSKMSRAECPVAKIIFSALITSPFCVCTPSTAFPFTKMSVTRVSNNTTPPNSIIFSRIALIIFGNLFVPICGCASINISSEAPKPTNNSKIRSTSPRFLERVYNLPSEYVPAPPSP